MKLKLIVRVSARGGWGDKSPPSNDSRDIPLNLNFLGNFFLVLKI
jgi:hypothetical protein